MSIHDIYDLDQGWATLDLEGHCPISLGCLKATKRTNCCSCIFCSISCMTQRSKKAVLKLKSSTFKKTRQELVFFCSTDFHFALTCLNQPLNSASVQCTFTKKNNTVENYSSGIQKRILCESPRRSAKYVNGQFQPRLETQQTFSITRKGTIPATTLRVRKSSPTSQPVQHNDWFS